MEVVMANSFLPRSVASLLLAIALTLGFATTNASVALAQGRTAVGSVEVDVSQLRAKGLGGFADMIGEAVRRELQAHYPSSRQGARLVVSLDSVFINGSAGIGHGPFGGFDSFAAQDSLSGTNYLVGRDGRVIETYPLNVSSPAAAAGPPMLPLERERAVILGQVYAQWLVRRF
jgi:hypothetical protein